MPKVTVLMPVYNGLPYLGEAIDSILRQTFDDFEFLIIDDCSTDSSVPFIESFSDVRIRLVRNEKNLGQMRSLNKGLQLARGEYVARLDQDDISLPTRLATQVAYLDSHPEVGLVSTNCYLIDSAGVITSGPILQGSLSGAQVEWGLYWDNPIVHPSVMFRSTVIRSCGGYPTEYSYHAEDYALWFQMATVTRMVVLQHPLLYLRKHQGCSTVVALHNHLNETIGVAQFALAERVGYRPSGSCIRLIRNMDIDHPVTSAEVRRSVDLLLDAFQNLAARYSLDESQARSIKIDLARRLLHLAYLGPGRVYLLLILGYVLRLSPRWAISRTGIKTFAGLLFGKRLINVVHRLRHRVRIA